jgi:3-hydroxyisobutyrate dehydrogenase-like beta-hydroxyacid dehydrogenase
MSAPGVKAGFIGLGSQGAPMARRIALAGFPLTLWARRAQTLEQFGDTHATTAATPAELAAASDVIGLCVRDDSDIAQVTSGPDGVLAGVRAGAVIAVHSTVHPDTCKRLAEQAATVGAHVVDAPVSGGQPAADAGRLLVMVGGEEADVAKCSPVFATYGDPVVHLGPLGAGQVAKLLNNAAFTAQLGLAAGLLALGEQLDIDGKRLAEVVLHGSARSYTLELLAAAGGIERLGGHAGPLLAKDIRLVTSLLEARKPGSDDPLLAVARDALKLMNVPLSETGS